MQIRKLEQDDKGLLADFFNKISNSKETVKFFHPHPFTSEHASLLADRACDSKDIYIVALENNKIVGYSMLRGWDEGFDIPSFGICVLPENRGKGVGKKLTQYSIVAAKQNKSPRIMLKVYKENDTAYDLYAKMGFEFSGETEDKKQFIGFLDLNVK